MADESRALKTSNVVRFPAERRETRARATELEDLEPLPVTGYLLLALLGAFERRGDGGLPDATDVFTELGRMAERWEADPEVCARLHRAMHLLMARRFGRW
ncbi:hypothetical protein [Phenylobacterium sp.]|jgi:hypothetical protein|uniref:hypothetical protein n=1 Tax=Phenylobacterium sp. TaxID=1871053 RepID=UPI002F91C6BF